MYVVRPVSSTQALRFIHDYPRICKTGCEERRREVGENGGKVKYMVDT